MAERVTITGKMILHGGVELRLHVMNKGVVAVLDVSDDSEKWPIVSVSKDGRNANILMEDGATEFTLERGSVMKVKGRLKDFEVEIK